VRIKFIIWTFLCFLLLPFVLANADTSISSGIDIQNTKKINLFNAHNAFVSGSSIPENREDIVEINSKKSLILRMSGLNSNCIEMHFKIFLLSGEGLPVLTRHSDTAEQERTFIWQKPFVSKPFWKWKNSVLPFGRWISVTGTTKILSENEYLTISFPINQKEAKAKIVYPKFKNSSDANCELSHELKIKFFDKVVGLEPNVFWDKIQLEKNKIPLKKVHIYGDLNKMLLAKARKKITGKVDFGKERFDTVDIHTAGVFNHNFNAHLPSMNLESKQLGVVRLRAIANRHFGLEKLSDKISRSLSLISPNSEIVYIYWNNQPLGIYYLEHWSNNLNINVLKPSNNFFQIYSNFIPGILKGNTSNNFGVPSLTSVKGSERKHAVNKIISLLELANKSLWQNDVAGFFRYVDKVSFYGWALNYMVMGSNHQTTFENFGIYFNPSTGKLEFLPRDVRSGPLTFFEKKNYYLSTVLSDSRHFLEFLEYSRTNLNSVKDIINQYEINDIPKIIAAAAFANFYEVNSNNYKISPYNPETILAYFNVIRRNITTLENLIHVPFKCKSLEKLRPDHLFKLPSERFVISKKFESADKYEEFLNNLLVRLGSEYKFFKFSNNSNRLPAHYVDHGHNRIYLNTKIDLEHEAKHHKAVGKNFIKCNNLDVQHIEMPKLHFTNNFYYKFFFTKTINGENVYTNRTRIVPLFSTLKVPKGVTVKFKAGSIILMAPGISIYSNGHLSFLGEKNHPILIRPLLPFLSSFGGVGIIGPDASLKMNYTEVSGGSLFKVNPYLLATGMFHTYQADVKIKNSIFKNQEKAIGVDDLLNFKNSKIFISNTKISNSVADAIDIDFALEKVYLDRLVISEVSNDAIDTAGSEVLITNTFINKCGDKGFSLGENSNVFSQNNVIDQCDVGVGIKETTFISSNDKFSNNQIGIAAYVKKDGLSKPSFSIQKPDFVNNKFDCGVQKLLLKADKLNSTKQYKYYPKKSKPDLRILSRSDLRLKFFENETPKPKSKEVVLEDACKEYLN